MSKKEKIMSRTHDVVELATGDVRVSVRELTVEQRIKLFRFYHSSISRHYQVHRGGSSFVPWEERSFGRHNRRIEMSLAGEALDNLKKQFWPKEEEYNSKTRMIPLYMRKLSLPNFSPPVSYRWKKGEEVVCFRLCLTQTGHLFLEWYEGRHTESEVAVRSSDFLPISTHDNEKEGNKRLLKLLEYDPQIISMFGHRVLMLLDKDATEREQRAQRDRELFNVLNSRGEIFNITYHP